MTVFIQVSQTSCYWSANKKPPPKLMPLVEPLLLCWAGQDAETNKAMFWKHFCVYTFQKNPPTIGSLSCLYILSSDRVLHIKKLHTSALNFTFTFHISDPLIPWQCFLHTCLHLIGYIHSVFRFSYALTQSCATELNLIPLVSVCTFSHFKLYSHNWSVKMLFLTFSKSMLQCFEHLWIFRQHRTRPKC